MSKINNITVNGDKNIIIQDVNGATINIYLDNDESVKKLLKDYAQELDTIKLLVSPNNKLKRVSDAIFKKEHIENDLLDRWETIKNLETRYENRMKEKMKTELRFQLELNLEYSIEGTNETYIKDYYIDSYEEKSAESFDILFADYVTKLKKLLILGEAGSGKTVLLLQFALKLIAVAKQDFDYPLPVFLSLATWRDEQQGFETWLEENLVAQFSFSKKYAKELATANNFLLLLDGLDEIPENDRKICLEKLRIYLDKVEKSQTTTKNYATAIISSRKQEYFALHTQAPVRATIQVAELTPENVCKELERIKQSQDTNAKILLNRIAENPSIAPKLKNAFEVHLALNMAQTFDFSQLNTENLVSTYLQQEIKELETKYNYPKAGHYLSFLAKKMKENKKGTVFELVDMQPSWAEIIDELIFYALYFLFGGITKILFLLLFIYCSSPFWHLLLFSIKFIYRFIPSEGLRFVLGVVFGVIFGVVFIVSSEFITTSIKQGRDLGDIRELNLKKFSRHNLPKKLGIDFLVWSILGLCVIVYIFPIVKPDYRYYLGILWGGIIGCLTTSVYVKEFFSIIYVVTNKKNTENPYKRFYYHLYFDFLLLAFLIFNFYFAVLHPKTVLVPIIFSHYLQILGLAFSMTLLSSPLSQHFILRFILFIETKIPLRLCTFLNKVSQTGILEKDGGQWRFRHQLLQDALGK